MNQYVTGGPARMAHQRRGLNAMIRTGGKTALLFDPGLGKTATVIDYMGLLALKMDTAEVRVLVVCPLAAVDTWVLQMDKFASPQIGYWSEAVGGSLLDRADTLAARGGNPFKKPHHSRRQHRQRQHPRAINHDQAWAWQARHSAEYEQEVNPTPTSGPDGVKGPRVVVEVINLDTLSQRRAIGSRTMADVMVDAIRRYKPELIVVDESHKIKGYSTNSSKLLARLTADVPRRILLTGTVMPHSPLDVFGQWRFLDPYAFGDLTKESTRRKATWSGFCDRYAKKGGWMGKEIVGFCNTPDAPIWMRDGTFKPLGEIKVGDSLMGWAPTEVTVKGGSRRIYVKSKVTGISRRWAENVVEVELSSGRKIKCTTDHKWLRVNSKDAEDVWVTVRDRPYHKNRGFKIDIARVVEVPGDLTPEERESAAWLAGFYDGEGHGAAFSQSLDHNPETCIRLEKELQRLGLTYGVTEHDPTKTATFYLTGGQQTFVNVLNWLPITRRDALIDLIHWSRASRYKKGLEEPKRMHKTRESVVKVTPLPPQEVISMQTTTGNYVAWGLASKNCNLDDMQEVLSRNAVVARKADALDLPATTDADLPVNLSAKESKAYNDMKDQLAAMLDDGSLASVPSRLTQMLRLRQITSGHLPDDNGGMHIIGKSKVETITSLVQDSLITENRVVIFAFFGAEIEQLSRALDIKGNEVMTITGSTPTEERALLRKRFGSDDPQRMIMVAQIKTMSLAVNELVTASHAVFASLTQQRDDYVQARDRLNRIGQTRPVTFWHAVVPGTVDEVILESHRKRTDLENAMLRHIRGGE